MERREDGMEWREVRENGEWWSMRVERRGEGRGICGALWGWIWVDSVVGVEVWGG